MFFARTRSTVVLDSSRDQSDAELFLFPAGASSFGGSRELLFLSFHIRTYDALLYQSRRIFSTKPTRLSAGFFRVKHAKHFSRIAACRLDQ